MNEIVKIDNVELTVKEFNGTRVVTFADIDLVHGRNDGTAKKNFMNNRNHFQVNKDYYVVTKKEVGEDFSLTYGFSKFTPNGTLLTESGYLMIVKSLNDPLAWDVQRKLVEAYFICQQLANKQSYVPENPEILNYNQLVQNFNMFLDKQSELLEQEHKSNEEFKEVVKNSFNVMANIMTRQYENILHTLSIIEKQIQNDTKCVVETTPDNVDDFEKQFSNFRKTIYDLCKKIIKVDKSYKNKSAVLSHAYTLLRNEYGICYDQYRKEFFDMNGRSPYNTMELVYWMETQNKAMRNMLSAKLSTIYENAMKQTGKKSVFPVDSIAEMKIMLEFISNKNNDTSPNHSATYRRFFNRFEKDCNINWKRYEWDCRISKHIPPSQRVSKIVMVEDSKALSAKCVQYFNEHIKELYADIMKEFE